jgi:DNA-binding beta-propeller fold protein YncE
MSSMNINKDRLITGGIIVLAVIGITYFGFNKQIPVNMQKITGIAIGPGEELYVSGDNLYLRLDQDGNISTTVKSGQTAMCLSIDQNKDVYLGMTDHVQVFNQDGILKDRWQSPGEKSLITSISVTSHHVYVADAGNFIVWQYDKMGELIKRIGEKDKSKDIPGFIIPSPYFDLAVDPDGFLWVANPGRLSLENYSKDGNIRSSWGTPGMKIEEFCGCCNPSHFTIFEDGSFVTSEKGIARVKVYNRLGQLTSVVAGPDQFTEGTVGLDLAVDSKNRIYVLDPTRKMVRIFEKKTEQRAT